jgi:hypothetical protein
MKKVLLIPAMLVGMIAANAQSPVQIIHNCPSPGADSVDIYVFDGANWGPVAAVSNLKFREATAYIPLPSGNAGLRVAIAPNTATPSITDTLASFAVPTLAMGQSYVAYAAGELGTTFDVFYGAASGTSTTGNFDVNIFHGSTDAPRVGVFTDLDAVNPVTKFSFGEFSGVATLPAQDLLVALTTDNINNLVEGFLVPLGTLNAGGLGGNVFASGYLAGTGSQPAFGLFVALPTGAVLPLPQADVSRVQLVHNSPDPAAAVADIWIFMASDGTPVGKDSAVAFRSATPFNLVPTADYRIVVTPTGVADTTVAAGAITLSLAKNVTYQGVAQGLLNPSAFPGADTVNGSATAFGFSLLVNAQLQANDTNNLDAAIFHLAPDAPAVDVLVAGGPALVTNVPYGGFTPNYLPIAGSGTPVVNITPTGQPTIVVGAYEVPAGALRGNAVSVFASGFLGQSPDFGLWASLPAGGNLVPLTAVTSSVKTEVISNTIAFPVPAQDEINIRLNSLVNGTVSLNVYDMTGRMIANLNDREITQGQNSFSADVSALSSGNYVLKITGVSINTAIRFVK